MKNTIPFLMMLSLLGCQEAAMTDQAELAGSARKKGGSSGGGGGSSDPVTRGSAAWFAEESAEYSVALQVLAGLNQADATGVLVTLTSGSAAEVVVTTTAGDVVEPCVMVDEWSHSNTVLKKEVYCGSPLSEPNFDLTRGTNAWAVVEGVEHSLRLFAQGGGSLAAVSSAASTLAGDTVTVELGLGDGSTFNTLCNRVHKTSGKWDLVCFAQ